MLHRMAECFCVVVPLKDTETSSGQLVILQAMMLGKPVIVTENKTARFYLEDNQTGFIIDKTPTALHNVLKVLSENPKIYTGISHQLSIFYFIVSAITSDAITEAALTTVEITESL